MLIQKSLDDTSHKSLQTARRDIWLVLCNIIEEVILKLLRKDVIGDTSDAHLADLIDADEVTDNL